MIVSSTKIFFLSFLISIISISFTAAQSKDVKSQGKIVKTNPQSKGSRWSVNCANSDQGLKCKILQRLILKKTNQLLLAVTVQKSEKSGSSSMLLQLPHGLFLPAGVKLQIDDVKPTTYPIQTCDPRGCYVGLKINAVMLKELKVGTSLSVLFQNLKKKNVKVPLPLNGFEAAYRKL